MDVPVIKNIDALGWTPLRRDALEILEAGYEAVLTERVIKSEIEMKDGDICIRGRNLCLSDYARVFFIGIGKCAVDASVVFEELLGERLTEGIVLDVKSGTFNRLRSFVGTHPFPSEENIEVTREIVDMLSGISERDLVLVVISGGGSSLLCLPHDMRCETLSAIVKELWKGGATIDEVNTVRKHLSDIQGGQLAKIAYPATVVSFIISDVPGDDIGVVASGPTVFDTTSVEDATRVLERYGVKKPDVSLSFSLNETPKETRFFERVLNILLVTNELALAAMRDRAIALGYDAHIVTSRMEGNAAELGVAIATEPLPPRSCLLYGGEATVRIAGKGEGGRNQELALAAVPVISDHRVLVAAASDGWDNSDVAGAICDAGDRKRAEEKGLSPIAFLENNDSYHFWNRIGSSIVTGRTGINVSDLYFTISE
jgi:glycerate-2-kinase